MTENRRNWRILVMFTYFSLGAFALISQTTMLREFFVVVYGNEFIFGVLLTNWLIGIFIGALMGGAISEKSQNNLILLVISIPIMCLLLPLSIILTRLLYTISGTPPGTYISFFKVFFYSALFIIPISFCIGLVFPLAARVQSQSSTPDSDPGVSKARKVKGISDIYVFEALGSLFSGMVYTFFLVGRCNAYMIAALVILPLLICSGLILWKSRYYKTFSITGVFILFTLAALWPAVNRACEAYTVEKRWGSMSTLPLVYSTDSKYQNIAVTNLFNQYNLYLNTMLSSVFPNEEDNLLLAVHLVCQHPAPQRILIIGDAVSGLAKTLLRFNIQEVISVEIDAKTVETIQKFLPPEDQTLLNDKRFKIIIQDGRKYIKDLIRAHKGAPHTLPPSPGFDIIYLNVSEPSTLLLNRYYTRECFADFSQVMKDNGVIALKITSSENYEKGIVSDYTASIYHTVKSVFPEVAAAPGPQNFLFASRDRTSITEDPDILAQRYNATGMKPKKLGFIFQSLYPREKTQFIKKALQHHRKSIPNSDETPISTLYFNKIIGWYAQSNLSKILGFFEKVKLGELIGLILVLLLARWFYVGVIRRERPSDRHRFLKFPILLAVFSGGMAGLSLELVILYTFQNHFGNIYHIIGFIIAIFMFGLPLGAMASNRLISRARHEGDENRMIGFLIFIQIGLAIIAFFLPSMTRWFAQVILLHQVVIFTATMLSGFGVGLVFPLSLHIYLGKPEKTGKTAGIIDAVDHLGAAAGAFLIGTLFLPVLGVGTVCRLVAFFSLMAAFLLFTDLMRVRRDEKQHFLL